jgi:hypothetical protein
MDYQVLRYLTSTEIGEEVFDIFLDVPVTMNTGETVQKMFNSILR